MADVQSGRARFSWREDPAVPAFDAGPVFTVMDAHCALCARGAAWIAANDRRGEFRIVPAQSPVGAAMLRHYGLDPDDPATWLYVEEGHAHASLDALMRAGRRLGGVWRGLALLRVLPRGLRDRLYRLVARNRYRVFGRADLCAMPDPEVQRRLLR